MFDPDYRRTGKFYTVHLEHYDMPVSNMPDGKNHPGLNLSGYTTTEPVAVPGASVGEGVILEWIDTNTKNTTFEGTAREILRTRLNTHGHPQGEIIFNPGARAGDPDWRVLYAKSATARRVSRASSPYGQPQRLDNFVGKILRIIPDLNEHAGTSFVSENGRYRIPNDNPFLKTKGRARRSGRTACAIRTASPGRSIRRIRRTTACSRIPSGTARGRWSTSSSAAAITAAVPRRQSGAVARSAIARPLPEIDKIPMQIGDEITDDVISPKYPVIQSRAR